MTQMCKLSEARTNLHALIVAYLISYYFIYLSQFNKKSIKMPNVGGKTKQIC